MNFDLEHVALLCAVFFWIGAMLTIKSPPKREEITEETVEFALRIYNEDGNEEDEDNEAA